MNERERQRANTLCINVVRACGNYIFEFPDALSADSLGFVNEVPVFATDYRLFVLVHTFNTLLAIVDRTESTLFDLSRSSPDFTKGFDEPFMEVVKTKYNCMNKVIYQE